eukprot:2671601-Ditylum_brightwellii.AAC.2
MNTATIVKNIKNCEETWLAFKHIRPITKEKRGVVVSYIKVPYALKSAAIYESVMSSLWFEPDYFPIDDSSEIMARLLQCNQSYLHQAFNTMFVQGLLKDYMGKYGLGE